MTKTRFALPLVGLLALSACQGGAQQTGVDLTQDAASGFARNISAQEVAQIKAICLQVAPSLIAGTASSAPTPVKDIAVYPYAFCQDFLSGKMYVDPKQQSVTWLDQVLKGLGTAAQIAGYVLPVVLPLL